MASLEGSAEDLWATQTSGKTPGRYWILFAIELDHVPNGLVLAGSIIQCQGLNRPASKTTGTTTAAVGRSAPWLLLIELSDGTPLV